MRLGFTVDVKGNVPVKVIARTFASGNSITIITRCKVKVLIKSICHAQLLHFPHNGINCRVSKQFSCKVAAIKIRN